MKKSVIVTSAICLALASSMFLSSCNKNQTVSNEDTAFVVSSEALDGVFNPFFYTTGPDGTIVGQTQIGMLSTDKEGNIVYGQDEPCVVENYTMETTGSKEVNGEDYDNYYTEYWFAIKNGIKFSDGSDLTIEDVIFSLYVLLDPTYTGSSTLYSTNIKGLDAYRAQSYDENIQDNFDSYYEGFAELRLQPILDWAQSDTDNQTRAEAIAELEAMDVYQNVEPSEGNGYLGGFSLFDYIDRAKELFREELNSDWTTASTTLVGNFETGSDYEIKYHFTEPWQVFLAMEGLLTFDDDKEYPDNVEWNGYENPADTSQEAMVKLVYDYYVGDALGAAAYKSGILQIVGGGWQTSSNLLNYVKSAVIQSAIGAEKIVKNISGIEIEEDVSSIGRTNPVDLGGTYDVLKITIDGVDPKAIYNFSFTVAPSDYYSEPYYEVTGKEPEQFDYAAGNVGVPFADSDFFDQLRQIQVPVGAGPYKATNRTTDVGDRIPDKSEFFINNVVYFERNTYFETVGSGLSNARIRKLNYQVVPTNQLFESLTSTDTVHFGTPNATPENLNRLSNELSDDYGYDPVTTLGYGYIGINAGDIPNILIRRAIMCAFDPSLTLDYYGGTGTQLASIVNRPMTSNSWAYPQGIGAYTGTGSDYSVSSDTYNKDISYDSTGKKSAEYARQAGYTRNANTGLLTNAQGEVLRFTFTIAGESDDHPAADLFYKAQDILESIGFDITVQTDGSALRKLATGDLTVWAAAWSSTIDPDMYQVYHMDSNATSTNNWGYPEIFDEDSTYDYWLERDIVEELSDLIDEAREMNDQGERSAIYHQCLDLVMELAVEFPTYQRSDLYVWNTNYIDSSTLAETSAYQSPLSRIWEVSFVGN